MTTQRDALNLANAIQNESSCIYDDVRDMTDNDDAFSIQRHIEIVERNLRALKAMLYSPEFHVTHDDDSEIEDMIAEVERGVDQILDYRDQYGI